MINHRNWQVHLEEALKEAYDRWLYRKLKRWGWSMIWGGEIREKL